MSDSRAHAGPVAAQARARQDPRGGRGRGHGRARLLSRVAGVRVPAAGRARAQEVRAGRDAARVRVRVVDVPPPGARGAPRRRAHGPRPAAQDTEGASRSSHTASGFVFKAFVYNYAYQWRLSLVMTFS